MGNHIKMSSAVTNDINNESDMPALPVAMPAKRVIKLTGKELTAELPVDISPELLAILLDRVGK